LDPDTLVLATTVGQQNEGNVIVMEKCKSFGCPRNSARGPEKNPINAVARTRQRAQILTRGGTPKGIILEREGKTWYVVNDKSGAQVSSSTVISRRGHCQSLAGWRLEGWWSSFMNHRGPPQVPVLVESTPHGNPRRR
jgi:hypothetical protein